MRRDADTLPAPITAPQMTQQLAHEGGQTRSVLKWILLIELIRLVIELA